MTPNQFLKAFTSLSDDERAAYEAARAAAWAEYTSAVAEAWSAYWSAIVRSLCSILAARPSSEPR